ncbi:TPA: hypothetical protein OMU21_004954 [Klebsiella aerogenes]|nr:hypothetical protein [Klebsiella aerogenes]
MDHKRLTEITFLTPLDSAPGLDEVRRMAQALLEAEAACAHLAEELGRLREELAADEAWLAL